MTTLEDLLYGNISPFEQYPDGNEKYQELLRIMTSDREKLSAELTSEQAEQLGKYDDIINEIRSLAWVETFIFGFRLSADFFTEALVK